MAHRRSTRTANRGPSPQRADSPLDERIRPWLLAATAAGFVARTLTPSETAADSGSGLPWVMWWLVLALLWGAAGLFSRRLLWRGGRIDPAVLTVVLCVTVSSLWALRSEAPRPTLNMLWEWIGLGLAFLLPRQLLRVASEGRALLAVMLALAVGHATYAAYQRFVSLPADQARYRADPEAVLREAGIEAPEGSPERKAFEDRLLYSQEPFSTFALTNSLAGYLAPWLIVGCGIVGLGWSRTGQWAGLDPPRVALAVLLAGVAACLYLTRSRTGYIAAGAGLLLLVGMWQQRRLAAFSWKVVGAAAIGGLLLIAAVAAVVGGNTEMADGARKSLGYRLEYWRATSQMIADHPLLGVGAGNFGAWYPQYKLPQAKEEIKDPHNFLLEVASSSGLLAALALVFLIFALATIIFPLPLGEGRGEGLLRGQSIGGSPSPQPSPGVPGEGAVIPLAPGTSRMVMLGGWLGCLCVYAGFVWPLPEVIALIGLPMAAALWTMRNWVDFGLAPPALPVIGAAVLLINLLAAGGIAYPSVANSLWLLAAVAVTAAEKYSAPRTALRQVTPAAALALAALTLACLTTGYQPVSACAQSLALLEAESVARNPTTALAAVREAAEADPLAAQPWQILLEKSFNEWRYSGSPAAWAEFERAAAECLRLEPRDNLAWRQVGLNYLEAFRRNKQPELARQAVLHLRRAAELYPSSADRQARLALALAAAGDQVAAADAAARALELHRQTPHMENQLSSELLEQLQRTL